MTLKDKADAVISIDADLQDDINTCLLYTSTRTGDDGTVYYYRNVRTQAAMVTLDYDCLLYTSPRQDKKPAPSSPPPGPCRSNSG